MAAKLRKLKLTKIALVPRGANRAAHVTLYKAEDATMADTKTPDAATLAKQVEELTAKLAKAVADNTQLMADLEKATKPEEKPEDKLAKADPAVQAVLKQQAEALAKAEKDRQAAEARIAKIEEERETEAFAKRAGELNMLGFTAGHAPILRKIHKALSAEESATLNKMLDGLQAAVSSSKLFKAMGSDEGTAASPEDRLTRMATERVQKSDGKETFEQAYTAILNTPEGKELYAQHRNGRN